MNRLQKQSRESFQNYDQKSVNENFQQICAQSGLKGSHMRLGGSGTRCFGVCGTHVNSADLAMLSELQGTMQTERDLGGVRKQYGKF